VTPAKVSSDFLSTNFAERRQRTPTSSNKAPLRHAANASVGRTLKADYSLPPLEDWEFPVDNVFANKVLAKLGTEAMRPQSSVSATLCKRCKGLNFWAGGFAIEDKVLNFKEKSNNCGFCRMLWGVCARVGASIGAAVRFEREDSTLRMSGRPWPVLFIFTSPGKWNQFSQKVNIQ
jgi:hypothetical protein